MSRLSKQTIRKLCQGDRPMIHPFNPDKVRVHGVSSGLSHASYDASIAHDLVLGRHPGVVHKEWVIDHFGHMRQDETYSGYRWWQWPRAALTHLRALNKLLHAYADLARRYREEPKWYSLAHTVEDFDMPANVSADVADKSTFARLFTSAYNTFFDPGFRGNATLELVNDSDQRVVYKAGQGVCQFVFDWLDEATEEPYSGKYQGQTKAAHEARFEPDDAKVTIQGGMGPVDTLVEITGCTSYEQAKRIADAHGGRVEMRAETMVPVEAAGTWFTDFATGERTRVPDPPALSPAAEIAEDIRRRELERLRWGRHADLERARDAYGLGQG